MRNFIKNFMWVLVLSLSALPASAYDFEVDGIRYDITSFTELTVTASSVSENIASSLDIPSFVEFNNKKLVVNTVGSSFAKDNNRLQSISIGDSIKSINAKAFYNCSELSSVQIKGSYSIGSECFKNCSKLSKIDLPNTLSSIGDNVFEGCMALEFISLPPQLTKMGLSVFHNCILLDNINLTNIDNIPSSLFEGCKSLKTISLSNNLMTIGNNAFSGTAFTEFVIPNSVTSIGNGILSNCSNLTTLTLGTGLMSLTSNPCPNCENLENLYILDSSQPLEICYEGPIFESISWHKEAYVTIHVSFYTSGLNDLPIKNIYLGRDLISRSGDIGYYKYLLPPLYSHDSLENVIIGGCLTELPETKFNLDIYGYYGNFRYNKTYGYFEDCMSLSTIEFNSTQLTTIGDRTFYGLGLHEIIIPNTVKNIGEYAFYGCQNLEIISIGKGVSSIGKSALSSNNKLSLINLYSLTPPSYSSGFENSQYINMIVNIPPNTLKEYEDAEPWKNFWNIKEDEDLLTEFTIEPFKFEILNETCVQIIGFTDTNIDKLIIPECVNFNNQEYKVTTLHFQGTILKNCSEIILPNSIVELPSSIFKDWIKLKYISLGTIEFINDNCFYNCKNLNNVIIPSSCKEIGNDCFNDCSSLKYIKFEISDTPITLGYNTSLTLSSSITPFPNPSDVDERRTGFRNGYYDGLFYGLPIEHLVINRDIVLPKYYERKVGSSTSSYSKVYNDIIYYPPFYDLTNLRSIEIGENVTAITQNTIQAAMNAREQTVEYTNFGKCDNIEVVVSNNSSAPIGGGFSDVVYESATLFLPNGGENSYKNDNYWRNYINISSTEYVPIQSIEIASQELELDFNESIELSVIISPEDVSISDLKWESSNSSIISVDEDGIIKSYQKEGEAIITATTKDGTNLSTNCKVKVVEGAGVNNVFVDENESKVIYNLSGYKISDSEENLAPGIYIVKQGTKTFKISIK